MGKGARIAAGELPPGAWRASVAVRFSHCDPAGIVYFPRYFDLLNGVIEDWFPGALGFPYRHFIQDRRVGLGPAHAEADFHTPGLFGDELVFTVLIEAIGRSSLGLTLHGHRAEAPILTARLVIVTTSLDERRAIPIPDDLRAAFVAYQERCR